MKRLIPFLTVLIVATVLFAFASRTEQGASIRADVRKRVAQIRDDIQEMTSDVEDATVEVETLAD
jgi:cell division protein FtsL